MNITESQLKEISTKFFRDWYNSPGSNTDQGWDEWWEKNKGLYVKESSIETYTIITAMGALTSWLALPFLDIDEFAEFNRIGYTGKDFSGNPSTYEIYLNSLGKGEFKVDQTRRDNGDFSEEFTVTRII